MSRDPYAVSGSGGNRSPRSARRVGELPTVDRSPSRQYPGGAPTRGKGRPTNTSPEHGGYPMSGPYYREDELASPGMLMDDRGRGLGAGHHRSRSASRPAMASSGPMSVRYQSLERSGEHEREFLPIREPRERSLDRTAVRDRTMERGAYMEEELYGSRSARQSPSTHLRDPGGGYLGELQHQNNDLQRELANFKKELELTNQKLGSSMHSIKTFWSPELKKERALRKEESAKYSLINDQLKLLNSENQKQAMLVRQLEEELRMRMRGPSMEMQQQIEVLFQENEHLTREVAILRETIKELELRIDTQKQTLQARDESIKKLLEMLQNKGVGGKMVEDDQARRELEARLVESENMIRHYESVVRNRDQELNITKRLDEFRGEIQRRDQEILAMSAKMKTLEEQHQDYQRHIAVLKESLCAKEEHYNMLQADVEELRQRLEEKNRLIEKKTQTAMQATQDRNRINNELSEIKDHMDIKDRKINVLQRKLDLREANKKLAAGAAKAGEESNSLRMQLDEQKKQLEEQKKQLEEQRRKLEEHRKGVDTRVKQLEEKEKSIVELEQKMKKRKEKLDQVEQQLQKGVAQGGGTKAEAAKYKEDFERAREDAKRSQEETERLLQLVQMSQEEHNMKDKTIHELQESLKTAQTKLKSQQTAIAQREQAARKAEEQIQESEGMREHVLHLEGEMRNNCAAVEEMAAILRLREARVEELEEALRESVRITADRERGLQQEESRRKHIMDKVGKLEQRLLSLQTAHALRCSTCRPLLSKLQEMERRLTHLIQERTQHLQELTHMKQEALEAAISEKDAHLALLEVSGLRTERQADEANQLRADRSRLMDRLKQESERSVQLLEDYASLTTHSESDYGADLSPPSLTTLHQFQIDDEERTCSDSSV